MSIAPLHSTHILSKSIIPRKAVTIIANYVEGCLGIHKVPVSIAAVAKWIYACTCVTEQCRFVCGEKLPFLQYELFSIVVLWWQCILYPSQDP